MSGRKERAAALRNLKLAYANWAAEQAEAIEVVEAVGAYLRTLQTAGRAALGGNHG